MTASDEAAMHGAAARLSHVRPMILRARREECAGDRGGIDCVRAQPFGLFRVAQQM